MPTEESGTPPVVETNPASTDPTPTPPATEPAAAATPADTGTPTPKGYEAFASWVDRAKAAVPAEADDSVFGEFTPESFENLDPKAQLAIRSAMRHFEKLDAERQKPLTEREEKIKAEAERVKAAEKALRGRERALLELTATAKPPAEGDEPDPFTPEGAREVAKREAQRARWEAEAPLRDRAKQLAQREAWVGLVEQYPDLRKPSVKAEFEAWLEKENEGVDLTKERPRRTTEDGAELFFLRKAQAAAAERVRADEAARQQERARAATHVGASSGAGVSNPLDTYQQIRKTKGDDAAWDYLEANPAAMKAYLHRYAPNHPTA